ncbi:MAG: PP2C family protein-serine/threonine phosphatase [Chlamydiota bacterium]
MAISNSFFSCPYYNLAALESNLSPFRKEPLSEEEAFQKMIKNGNKALIEHHDKEPFSVYPSLKALSFLDPTNPSLEKRLNITYGIAEAWGSRKKMEDVSFITSFGDLVIAGVLDGHGGDHLAKFASKKFQEIFPCIMGATKGHVHQALEVTTAKIQKAILEDSTMHRMGSTAVFSVIDPVKRLVITGTLGDSEANIYRKKDEKTISIPLSNLRDWTSKKDEERARLHCHPLQLRTILPGQSKIRNWNFIPENSKDRRLKSFDCRSTTNVSRAFGKYHYGQANSHKLKITVSSIQEDDVIIVTSDGLKEYPEADIAHTVSLTTNAPGRTSRALVNLAISREHCDNTSVIAIYIS